MKFPKRQMQQLVFMHLKEVVRVQNEVRNGEVEGMVMPIESKLDHAMDLGLIDLAQWSKLRDDLKS